MHGGHNSAVKTPTQVHLSAETQLFVRAAVKIKRKALWEGKGDILVLNLN